MYIFSQNYLLFKIMTFTYEFGPFVDITLVQQNYLNFMRKYPLV